MTISKSNIVILFGLLHCCVKGINIQFLETLMLRSNADISYFIFIIFMA